MFTVVWCFLLLSNHCTVLYVQYCTPCSTLCTVPVNSFYSKSQPEPCLIFGTARHRRRRYVPVPTVKTREFVLCPAQCTVHCTRYCILNKYQVTLRYYGLTVLYCASYITSSGSVADSLIHFDSNHSKNFEDCQSTQILVVQ